MKLKTLLLPFFIFTLISCVSTYESLNSPVTTSKIDKNSRFLISTPEDGFYGTIVYNNSGKMLRGSILNEFIKYSNNFEILEDCKSYRSYENSTDGRYFIESKILHWEDRNTEWSGKPDRIKIQIIIYDMTTNEMISNYIFSGKSKILSFGGDHPQDLLEEPMSEYFSILFN